MDASTLLPVRDVMVIRLRKGTKSVYAHSRTVCMSAESAVTNEKGEYDFSASYVGDGFITGGRTSFFAYKPGYEYAGRGNGYGAKTLYIEATKGGVDERFLYFKKALRQVGCSGATASDSDRYDLYKDMYYEARALAITDNHLKTVKLLREIAAWEAVNTDEEITSEEMNKRVEEYLQDHLQ